MKLFVALLLNALLVAGLVAWLRVAYRRAAPGLRRWLLPTLALRLTIGFFQKSPDAVYISTLTGGLTEQLWARPGAAWALWQGNTLRIGEYVLTMYKWSNTLFVIKLLALLNVASLGSLRLNSLYFTLACYVACWQLVSVLRRLFPAAPLGAVLVAFLLWPSVVWWSTGIAKETLVIGTGAALVALTISELYGPVAASGWARLRRGLLLLGLAWLHLRLRYFFALPLLGSLLALSAVVLAGRRGWLQAGWRGQAAGLVGGLAVAGALAVALGGEPVSKAFVTSQLWDNYLHGIKTSVGRPHLVYPGLRPTAGSMVAHFPLAATQALVRPWLGEAAAPLYLVAALENLLLIGLLGWAAVAVWRGRPGRLPPALVLALLLYCLVLAGLIGLSTPNLGTLHRYRAVLLPWLLWLLLQHDGARQLLRRLKIGD